MGPFRADILCRDTATGHWVLIENQLERTDHVHLGQLLTYAAGLRAVTIIWVADRFKEEHRAALDWLNEITGEGFNFFGVEVELWRIGDSPVAPKFNVVSKPNDWSRTVAREAARAGQAELSEARQLQLDFWAAFREYVERHGARFKPTKPLPQQWMAMALGRTGFHLSAVASFLDTTTSSFSGHELRAEVVVDNPAGAPYVAQLEGQKAEIERELGEPLTWHNPEDTRQSRIYLRRSADLNDRDNWPDLHEWLREKLDGLHRVFGPRVKQLRSGEQGGAPEAPGERSAGSDRSL